MVTQLELSTEIIEKFDALLGRKLPAGGGLTLFEGDGFTELLVNVIVESSTCSLISIGHYLEHEEFAYPDPCLHFRVDWKRKKVSPLLFKSTIDITQVGAHEGLSISANEGLKEFLLSWLNTIQLQHYKTQEIPKKWQWKRQQQEKGGNYVFDGQLNMTDRYKSLLNPFEKFCIMLDLDAFVLHKGGVDYIQSYVNEKSGQQICCVDELSKSDKARLKYIHKSLKDANRFTFMLQEEY